MPQVIRLERDFVAVVGQRIGHREHTSVQDEHVKRPANDPRTVKHPTPNAKTTTADKPTKMSQKQSMKGHTIVLPGSSARTDTLRRGCTGHTADIESAPAAAPSARHSLRPVPTSRSCREWSRGLRARSATEPSRNLRRWRRGRPREVRSEDSDERFAWSL